MFSINLNDFKSQDINHDFAYANVDGYKIKFHKPTNYINIAYTAKTIDEIKWSKYSDQFWQSNKTNRILKLLSNDIINSLDIDDETKKSRIQKVNENTLIPSKCDNTKYIEAQLQEHPTFIVFNNTFSNETRGCYVHPDLFIFAIIWVKNTIGIQLSNVFTRMSTELTKNNEYVSKLENEIKDLDKQIKDLETKKIDLESKLIEANSLNGSIKLSFDKNELKLHHENYNQVQGSKDFVIQNIFNSKSKRDKIYYFVKEHLSNVLEIGRNRNHYIINHGFNQDNVVEHIRMILKSKSFEQFQFNTDEYIIRLTRYKIEKSIQSYGFLFESEMSKKYHAFLYKDIPKHILIDFGLDHKDTGIDLVDLKNKILYQCKCYTTTKLTLTDSLKRSLKMLKKFQSIDQDYQLKFIFNEGIDVDQEVLDLHVPILYEQTTLEETLHVSIEEALRATLDAFVDDEDESDDVIEEEEEQEEVNEDGFGITINDYIQQHIDEKADDLITFINANISKFIDGVKPLTKQAFWTRKCRIKNGRR